MVADGGEVTDLLARQTRPRPRFDPLSDEEAEALAWLSCVAEGDREGLVINAHTARRAAVIRRLLNNLACRDG